MSVYGLSHVGIAVPDLEAGIAVFSDRLGLTPGPILENAAQGVRLVQFDLSNGKIELISPTGPGPIAAFLERNPKGGLHHLGLFTDNIEAALGAVQAKGVRALSTPTENVFGKQFAFLHPADLIGVLVELENR